MDHQSITKYLPILRKNFKIRDQGWTFFDPEDPTKDITVTGQDLLDEIDRLHDALAKKFFVFSAEGCTFGERKPL